MVTPDYGFTYNGQLVSPSAYGPDYIPELTKILENLETRPRAVLEWGSGLTTQVLAAFAEHVWHSDLLLSLDDNFDYQSAIFRDRAEPSCLTLKCLDLTGPCRDQRDRELNYSTYPLAHSCKFDLIFIDGRRRIECAFVAFLVSHPNTTVILHDFRRSRYQPVVVLYDIVFEGAQFRVLRPRSKVLSAMEPGIVGLDMYMKCLSYNMWTGS